MKEVQMQRPNILFFCADELTRGALGCYGADYIKTPIIDCLARSGTRFACNYSNSPLCVPSRGSMITGRYVHEVGCWDNGHPYHGTPKGWAHQLREAGYRTISIGKNHYRSLNDDNGFDKELLPMHVRWGIGDIFGMLRKEGATYRNLGNAASGKTQEDSNSAPLFGPAMMAATAGPGESNHTDYDRRITGAVCDWLAGNAACDEPWALYISYVSPHFPLTAPQEFYRLYADLTPPAPYHYSAAERPTHPAIQNLMRIWNYDDFFNDAKLVEARRSYYALISFLDHNIGTVIKALNEATPNRETLLVVVSDHGEMLGNKGIWSTSAMYEDSVGVPLIISGPGFPVGRVVETPTSNIDLAPTLVAAGGGKADGAWRGGNLGELAARPEVLNRVVFSEYHAGGSDTAFFMLRKGKYKYIAYVGYPPELFDLSVDPREGHNLAEDMRYAAIRRDLDAELRTIVDPDAVNAAAFAAQAATIEKHGGVEAVRRRGHPGEHSLDRKLGVE
jgi:choline-sulfatase